MSVTIALKVEDVDTRLLTYTSIQLYSASTVDGSYSLVATITLVTDDFYYTYVDSAGSLSTWYKYRFHNPTGPVDSDYSNPFQVQGITRKKIRQQAIGDYETGLVLSAASSGQTVSAAAFSDYRVRSSVYGGNRGVGTWLLPTNGLNLGVTTLITDITQGSPAVFSISPSWAQGLATSDEVEWHWFASPDDWNTAINKALLRYYFLDRIPIVGDGNAEQSLSYVPWLNKRTQVAGLWFYPISNDVERAWGMANRWWDTRQEGGYLTLMTRPALQTSDTVYMECLRTMPQVFTDDSLLPNDCNIELAAALAYDEILSNLLRPSSLGAAAFDKTSLMTAQKELRTGRLRILRNLNRPNPRWQPSQLYEQSNYLAPWRSR